MSISFDVSPTQTSFRAGATGPFVSQVIVRIDGDAIGPFAQSQLTDVKHLLVGARNPILVAPTRDSDHSIDDAKLGTTAYGSTDLFSDGFGGATIVPPFSSEVGGAYLALSGGKMVCTPPSLGAGAYAQYDLPAAISTGAVYASCVIDIADAEYGLGISGEFLTLVSSTGGSLGIAMNMFTDELSLVRNPFGYNRLLNFTGPRPDTGPATLDLAVFF